MEIKEFFAHNCEVAVAFSGGVDSAVLLALAKQHAKRVKAYYVKTVFQPAFELEDAAKCADLLGVELSVLECDILADSAIAENPENRCYFCKRKLLETITRAAKADGFFTVLDGTNADDRAQNRPGMKALEERCVLSPLRLCSLKKEDIRNIARQQGLPVADKPSYACLATRIPAGTKITASMLAKTELAENKLREEGLKNFRVRYHGGARLELGQEDFRTFFDKRREISDFLMQEFGFAVLDLKERSDND